MHFYKTWTWFLILMWLLKNCLNSQTCQNVLNNQTHARAMKIRPKTEKMNFTSYEIILILDHEETSPIRFWDVFHEIWSKISFHNPRWKGLSHGVRWKKSWILVKKCFFYFENVVINLSFLNLKSFHTSQTSMRWKSLKTQTKSSLLSKILNKLSLLVSPLALQS